MQVLSTHPITVFVKQFFLPVCHLFWILVLASKAVNQNANDIVSPHTSFNGRIELKGSSSSTFNSIPKNHLKHQSSVRPSIHQFVIQSLCDCIDTKLPNAKILKANKQKKKQIKFKFLLHYTNRMEKFTFFGYSFFLALNLTVEILCNTNEYFIMTFRDFDQLKWRFFCCRLNLFFICLTYLNSHLRLHKIVKLSIINCVLFFLSFKREFLEIVQAIVRSFVRVSKPRLFLGDLLCCVSSVVKYNHFTLALCVKLTFQSKCQCDRQVSFNTEKSQLNMYTNQTN